MGKVNFRDDFKRDALARITGRGEPCCTPGQFGRQQAT